MYWHRCACAREDALLREKKLSWVWSSELISLQQAGLFATFNEVEMFAFHMPKATLPSILVSASIRCTRKQLSCQFSWPSEHWWTSRGEHFTKRPELCKWTQQKHIPSSKQQRRALIEKKWTQALFLLLRISSNRCVSWTSSAIFSVTWTTCAIWRRLSITCLWNWRRDTHFAALPFQRRIRS